MGIGSKLKKAVKKVGGAFKVDTLDHALINVATGGLYGAVNSRVALAEEVKDATVKGWQDMTGHTAKAREEAQANRQIAENKALAAANADVSRDAADIVLGETSDTAGESLTDLRKKRTSALSTQVGIS